MNDSRKKRMSLLDTLTTGSAPPVAASMMSSNRALRSARDAVDAHRVWDLDPADIDDSRFTDRLDPKDVADLRTSIEANGQTVPILVRRHPTEPERYQLVYGRRRLEAIRGSERLDKVRALIATLDETAALKAQISENTARRDLSYIERALFAVELLDSGYGNQAQIAEVLNATRSAISMAVSVARTIGAELAGAIGPAHGIGRPRWEALSKDIATLKPDLADLVAVASDARDKASGAAQPDDEARDGSGAAFEAVARHLRKRTPRQPTPAPARSLIVAGKPAGRVQKTAKGLRLELTDIDPAFAGWIETEAQALLEELYDRWKKRP